MLMLLFQIGEEPWAIAATEVEAVIPLVSLQKMALPAAGENREPLLTAPIAGLLNYGGEIMPAVDVSALVANLPAPRNVSTRIAIVKTGIVKTGIVKTGIVKTGIGMADAGKTDAGKPGTGESIAAPPETSSSSPKTISCTKLGLILDRATETAALSDVVTVPIPAPYVETRLRGPQGKVVQQLAIAPLAERLYRQHSCPNRPSDGQPDWRAPATDA